MLPEIIFTRRRMGLDTNVWLLMLVIFLLSAGFLGYSFVNKKEEKPCRPINIYVNGRSDMINIPLHANEPLTFRSPVSTGDIAEWDFEDGSEREQGFSAVHVFKKAQKYTVKLFINDKCVYNQKIVIREVVDEPRDSSGNAVENIVGETLGNVGDAMTFHTLLPAREYEWAIDNLNNYARQKTRIATYTFRREGTYKLILVLDKSSSKKYTKTITVLKKPGAGNDIPVVPQILIRPVQPKKDSALQRIDTGRSAPEVAPPAPKKYRTASNEIIKSYFQSLVCGDLQPKDFNTIFCLEENTPIIINRKDRKLFSAFCKDVQNKRIKIESVVAGRDNENCIINVAVTFDKKGFLGKSPCKN